jgi:hypothetical protein
MIQYKDTPYFVDTEGNVYRSGKKLKGSMREGYIRLDSSYNNKRIQYSIHRLVAELYIPNPENKPEVNHINGVKTDNRVDNLEWNTSKENTQHAINNNLMAKGEYNGNSKLKEKDIIWIRNNCIPNDKKLGYRPLSKLFNIHRNHIKKIFTNQSWKHLL